MEDIDFDIILNEIDEIYNEYEIEYNSYIKTRQILPYNPIDSTILTAIYCYSALLKLSFFF
jgi:hypothetical protein